MPSSPSYARPTAASATRAVFTDPKKAPANPKKLKRPSTLSDDERLIQRAKAWTIKSANHLKPCPLATLPLEVRVQIYQHVLQDHPNRADFISSGGLPLVPKLLHVSRAIRYEAAYEWYRWGRFRGLVFQFQFNLVIDQIKRLPILHRMALAKSPHLELEIKLSRSPRGLWDKFDGNSSMTSTFWKDCRQFGNLHRVKGSRHKDHFIYFCRVASWLLWCGRVPGGFNWNYKPIMAFARGPYWAYPNGSPPDPTPRRQVEKIFESTLDTFQLPCVVAEANVRSEDRAIIKKEASKMLDNLDKQWQWHEARPTDDGVYWATKLASLKRFLEKW